MNAVQDRLVRSLFVSCLLLLAACATGPKISSVADPQADFSRYRSFAFYAPLAIESKGYATATSEAIKAAARRQMEARGYRYDPAAPDLWINLGAYLQEKIQVSSIPDVGYDAYYSYRGGGYFVSPYWHEHTTVRTYTEGTLNVDLVDVAQRRLVWEGVAVGTVHKLTPAERAAKIDSAMAGIFAQFPYRAGQAGTPSP